VWSIRGWRGTIAPDVPELQSALSQQEFAHGNLRNRNFHTKGEAMEILWWAIVGIIAGFLTGKIMSAQDTEFARHDIGLSGAIVEGFIARQLGLASSGGLLYTILIAVLAQCW